jgi:hypothetical protein
MGKGQKTGGRQKGTRNKAKVRLDVALEEATQPATACLSPSEVATMTPPEVMHYAMRLELLGGQWRSAASIAEKAAPYVHQKMAPRAEDGWRRRSHDQDRRRAARIISPNFRTAADRV